MLDLVVVGSVGGRTAGQAVDGGVRTAGRAVRRSGGRVGDRLWVTGRLGGPLAAIRAWESGKEPDLAARERFVRPVPRIAEAQWLRDRGATAMIDLSDGLYGDAGHLAAASGVSCMIETERLPKHPSAESPEDALVSGEEYELLVAMPEEFEGKDASEFAQQFALPLTHIGRLEEGKGVIVMEGGNPLEVGNGFQQYDD